MAAIHAVLTTQNRGKVEFQNIVGDQSSESFIKVLQEGLKKVQKDINDKLTDYINEDKAVNGSSTGAATKEPESEGERTFVSSPAKPQRFFFLED